MLTYPIQPLKLLKIVEIQLGAVRADGSPLAAARKKAMPTTRPVRAAIETMIRGDLWLGRGTAVSSALSIDMVLA